MSMSSSEEEVGTKEKDMAQFVQVIMEHGKCLVQKSKSKLPKDKEEKKEAIKAMQAEFEIYGIQMSEKEIKKRILNIDASLRRSMDKNRTGNKRIKLKEHQVIWKQLLEGQSENVGEEPNPRLEKLNFGLEIGAPSLPSQSQEHQFLDPSPSTSSSTIGHTYRRKTQMKSKRHKEAIESVSETEETQVLSTAQLQRLVLLEQLKASRAQQESSGLQSCTGSKASSSGIPYAVFGSLTTEQWINATPSPMEGQPLASYVPLESETNERWNTGKSN